MKRTLLFFLLVSLIAVFGASSGEAFSTASSPVATQFPDDLEVLNTFDLGCGSFNNFDHAVLFFNNTDQTAMGTIVDGNGDPDPTCLGFSFIAADFLTGQLWVSNDGFNWSPF